MGTDREEEKHEEKKQSQFIKEKVVKRPLSPKEKGKRVLWFCLAALFFGCLAGTAFAISSHMVGKGLSGKETEENTFTIPDDETESQPEQTEASKAPESTPVSTQDSWEQWQKELEQKIAPSLVTLHVKAKGTDPFNNIFENEKECSGCIIGQSGQEYLVLAPWSPISGAESISVKFYNGTWAQAQVKGKDGVTDMAVLSVSVDLLPTFGSTPPVPMTLGNSYQASKGDRVLAVGSPFGILNSSAAGSIVGAVQGEGDIDSSIQILYSNIGASSDGLGFLLNEEGSIIGLLTSKYTGETDSLLTSAVGISDLKQSISNLGQGNELPYLGVRIQAIDKGASASSGLPVGLYVTEVLQGSPAYEAGIQPADIITAMGVQELDTVRELKTTLFSYQSGDKVKITVQRSGKDGYTPIEYTVTLGSR